MSELTPPGVGFCSIDAQGFVFDQNKQPLQDPNLIRVFFESLSVGPEFEILSQLNNQTVLVEAFDAPLVAQEIKLVSSTQSSSPRMSSSLPLPSTSPLLSSLSLGLSSPSTTPSSFPPSSFTNAYGIQWNFDLSTLVVDEWDRFHGLTTNKIPFVLSNQAQDQFFDQLDEFDDDSFQFAGTQYTPDPFWLTDSAISKAGYWSQRYLNNEARWDLGDAAMGLQSLLPKLKLPASRVLVLGGGSGHDAAYFAKQGHHVTLVDISPEAIAKAQSLYAGLGNLTFIESDVFNLPSSMYQQYDLIFEHTCFCAIDPHKRDDLIKQWRRLLHNQGTLLGVFFTMPKRIGPPFGASEWELQRRLQNHFQTLVWQRMRQSIKPRLGRELLVYLQKKPV